MKYFPCIILILSLILINQEPAMSQACTDPGGCSAVSYAAFQHTVGVVQFGNTTGRVVSKKKATLCPEANCNSFFTMTTALVAPRTTSGVSKAAPAASVTVISVRRALSTVQTGIFRNTLALVSNAFRQVPARTKFSSFPFSMGFGNNSIGFLSLSASRNRIVSQNFNPTANTLSQTITQVPAFANELASAISRDGSLLAWGNRKDAQTANFNFRSLNTTNRRPAGAPEVIAQNLPVGPTFIRTVSAIAVSDAITTAFSADNVPGERSYIAVIRRQQRGTIPGGGVHKAGEEEEEEDEDEISSRNYEANKPNTGTIRAAALGPPNRIKNKSRSGPGAGANFFQSLAIDPKARFVLYAGFSASCNKNILKFQRINPLTGKKIGGPKVLAGCADFTASTTGAYGLNVINLE